MAKVLKSRYKSDVFSSFTSLYFSFFALKQLFMFIPKFLFSAAAVLFGASAVAQNETTLKQCIEYGIHNSVTLQKASLEVDKNKQKENEDAACQPPPQRSNSIISILSPQL